jgi:hypothetical protein
LLRAIAPYVSKLFYYHIAAYFFPAAFPLSKRTFDFNRTLEISIAHLRCFLLQPSPATNICARHAMLWRPPLALSPKHCSFKSIQAVCESQAFIARIVDFEFGVGFEQGGALILNVKQGWPQRRTVQRFATSCCFLCAASVYSFPCQHKSMTQQKEARRTNPCRCLVCRSR